MDTLAANTATACGVGDSNLPPEPTLPTNVCQTLTANKSFPDENNLDTQRINDALSACPGGVVQLVSDGANNAFVAGHLTVTSATLWIDSGTTLYASRDPNEYPPNKSSTTGTDSNCGVLGVNDSAACSDFITVGGTNPGIVGDGVIDGQGGEPLVGHDYSWWQLSFALREIDGSIGNPTLINVVKGTNGFLLYRITLHNSPKFHVKIAGTPTDGTCTTAGEGYTVWGVTILTPSRWTNSQGLVLSPYLARNTDGVDPGENDVANCGVIACSTISTGDDNIAIKGGHGIDGLIIAHNRFGTGHGMSIGSETYGGVHNVSVYDLTIDADSRWTGSTDTDTSDSNGIRVKSDESRGGIVDNVTFSDVCIRDVSNTILVSTAYNPLFAGSAGISGPTDHTDYPQFKSLTFQNIHEVTCMSLVQPVVTLEGFNAVYPAGPITLDNVIVDNIGPQDVAAEFADIRLGPGNVNFTPSGLGVTVTNNITAGSAPRTCSFPPLPAPEIPAGWLR